LISDVLRLFKVGLQLTYIVRDLHGYEMCN